MTKRKEWLIEATRRLQEAGIDSAHLDSELLLCHALRLSRTALHAHEDETIPSTLLPVCEAMLSLRVIRVPLAYIIGHKEFYGRLFKVTPSVLIPRPESEVFIEYLKELPAPASLIDVGTGSGALGITAALELSGTHVVALDVSKRALEVARFNADYYNVDVTLVQSDLLEHLETTDFRRPLYIMANLPYIVPQDQRSPETDHEPPLALFALQDGLLLIERLIDQASALLGPGDYLLLESNPAQQPAIADYSKDRGFILHETRGLISILKNCRLY